MRVAVFHDSHTKTANTAAKCTYLMIQFYHLTGAQRTPSAAAAVQVSLALPAVSFSCLLRGRGASFQDGVTAGKRFLCAPFGGVQICDYSAA